MIIKSAKLLVATIGLSLGSAAIAEDLIGTKFGDLTYVGTIDSSTLWYRESDVIQLYPENGVEFIVFEEASKNKKVPYRLKKTTITMDCSAGSFAVLDVEIYRPNGTLIRSTGRDENPKKGPIGDGGVISNLFKMLCL